MINLRKLVVLAASLAALAQRLDLEEIVINTWTHDPTARRHSYELLAEAFGLASSHDEPVHTLVAHLAGTTAAPRG